MEKSRPGALLRSRRFLPFFITQALGALNDNLFKNALLLLLTFQAGHALGVSTTLLVNLAAGLFILPFFLFSPLAGQLSDRYEKSAIIRWTKLLEILLMGCAALALLFESWWILLGLLFGMGLQSAFFGPVKYAILPQHLRDSELVGGNALVEAGTFLAILLGTLCAGLLMTTEQPVMWIASSIVGCAVAGYLSSRAIPAAESTPATEPLQWNPIRGIADIWRILKQRRSVMLSVMAISWFWFLGASYLTQFPAFTRDVLLGDESVVTLLLAVFSIGIGLGSLLCERLSGDRVELGIVPIGALGLTLFGLDLGLAQIAAPLPSDTALRTWRDLLDVPGGLRVLLDLLGIGLSGGLFIVPLYALVQQRTPSDRRARIIAANNVLNAAFMVGSAIWAVVFLSVMQLDLTQYFAALAWMNLVVCWYVFIQIPEFTVRLICWLLTHCLYRLESRGLHNIPETGPALLICNHVSYADAPIIAGGIRRPVRFVMDRDIAHQFGLRSFFRLAGTIPICAEQKDPDTFRKAFETVHKALQENELVCIFPEGRLSPDGTLQAFKRGAERILERDPVPVVPLALDGLWGSFFSHRHGHAMTARPRRFWSRIRLLAGSPIPATQADTVRQRNAVEALLEQSRLTPFGRAAQDPT